MKTFKEYLFLFIFIFWGVRVLIVHNIASKLDYNFQSSVAAVIAIRMTSLKRMSKARYVTHYSPGIELGLHERVLVPLFMETLVVSEESFV